MRVFTRSPSSGWTTRPGRLFTSRRFSSSYKISSWGLKTERKAFSGVGASKNSSLMYSWSRSPFTRRVSRLAPLPLSFTRLMRMYFWARGAGRRGRVLASHRSSRWPASLGPTVNSRMEPRPFWRKFPLDGGRKQVYPTILAAAQGGGGAHLPQITAIIPSHREKMKKSI